MRVVTTSGEPSMSSLVTSSRFEFPVRGGLHRNEKKWNQDLDFSDPESETNGWRSWVTQRPLKEAYHSFNFSDKTLNSYKYIGIIGIFIQIYLKIPLVKQ